MIKRFSLALLLLVSLLFAGTAGAPAPASAAPTSAPNATGLMGSRPPSGDPLSYGKQIKSNPAKNPARSAKGAPTPPSFVPIKKTPGGPYYKYAVGKQFPATPPTGVSALLTIAKPYTNPTYDWHSLTEIAVQSADEQQIVEVGWTRDQYTYGDNLVHMFVYHWVNGQETCYDGCGWVDYAANTTTYAGMSLESWLQSEAVFAIERTSNAWWIGFGLPGSTEWIGNFPDALWTGATPSVTTFKQVNLFQGFGEVAAGSASASCADMGSGPTMVTASPTAGAKIYTVTYSGQPASSVGLTISHTDSHWPSAIPSGKVAPYRDLRYGGGGYC